MSTALKLFVASCLVAASGCGGGDLTQKLTINGHGKVSLLIAGSEEAIGPLAVCDKDTCDFTFDSTHDTLQIVATPDSGWEKGELTGTPHAPDASGKVDVRKNNDSLVGGWSLVVNFKKLTIPACTTGGSTKPTLTAPSGPFCVGKFAYVRGTGLKDACLALGSAAVTPTASSDGDISFNVPAGTPTGDATLTASNVGGSASTTLTISNDPEPTATTPPTTGKIGQKITLTGTGLSHVKKVEFLNITGGAVSGTATFTVVSDTELEFTVAAGTAPGHFSFMVSGDCGRVTPFDIDLTNP